MGWVDGFRRCETAIFTHSVCDLGWSRPCGSGVTAAGQWVERKCTAVLPTIAYTKHIPTRPVELRSVYTVRKISLSGKQFGVFFVVVFVGAQGNSENSEN